MNVTLTLTRANDAAALRATNAGGVEVLMDGSPDVGGQNLGQRPTELLLAALAGCATMDVLEILRKQREPLAGYRVEVVGTRPDEGQPRPYTRIELVFYFGPGTHAGRAERAVALSLEKYCSVAASLDPRIQLATRVVVG
jgi:putative redox protein